MSAGDVFNRFGLFGLVGFLCFIGEKPFSVGLVDQLFQPTSNQVETVKKAFACLHVCCVRTIPSSYHIATEIGLKSVLLRNINCTNQNQLEKCSIEKCQPNKPKLVVVKIVDPNRTQAYYPNYCISDVMKRNEMSINTCKFF